MDWAIALMNTYKPQSQVMGTGNGVHLHPLEFQNDDVRCAYVINEWPLSLKINWCNTLKAKMILGCHRVTLEWRRLVDDATALNRVNYLSNASLLWTFRSVISTGVLWFHMMVTRMKINFVTDTYTIEVTIKTHRNKRHNSSRGAACHVHIIVVRSCSSLSQDIVVTAWFISKFLAYLRCFAVQVC